MGFIVKQKIGNKTLTGFYKKVETEADASRFVGAENGQQELIQLDDDTKVEVETSGTSYLVSLGFSYLVGANQLMVLADPLIDVGATTATGFSFVPNDDLAGADTVTNCTFEEVDATTVRLKFSTSTVASNCSSMYFLFMIPHTATPAVSREKLLVKDQGDNVAIELEGFGDGVLMTSPNGAKWLLRVDDSGNIVAEAR